MRKERESLIYFIKDVEELTGRNRQTLRRWWKKGIFPEPARINNRLAWHADVIDQWIRDNLPAEAKCQHFISGANVESRLSPTTQMSINSTQNGESK